jgi:hypothetical protein
MVGDIFSASLQVEGRDSNGTMNFHYQEVDPSDPTITGTFQLSRALMQSQFVQALAGMMALPDVAITGCVVRKLFPLAEAPGYHTQRVPGTVDSVALPFNNGVRLQLQQEVFPAKNNGMVWIPGIPESGVAGNTLTGAFITIAGTPVVAFAIEPVERTPDPGRWRLGVLSRKFLADNPGDYEGAFAVATNATMSPIIGTQRRRTTRRRGAPGASP